MMEPLGRKASREDYLSTLSNFMKSSDHVIKNFTKEIGWTKPPDRNNVIQVHKSMEKVSEDVSINEYSEEPLLPSFLSSASNKFSVKIDADKQRNLLPYRKNAVCMRIPSPDLRHPPASAGEMTVNYTREERLILYEHTLQEAAPVPIPPELILMNASDSADSQPKELSGLELKKAMRDFKRRRQAYRTKVSTKNKTETEVTREIIQNMMALLGMEEANFDVCETPKCAPPLCNADGDNDLDTLDKRAGFNTSVTDSRQMKDVNYYTKHREEKPRRSEHESHSRNRSPRESMKYQKYDNAPHDTSRYLSKDEKKYRRMEKRYDKKSEGRGTPEKYQARCKDRGSSQSREMRRGKNNDESEYKDYEHRKMKKHKKDKYDNEERHHRQEYFSSSKSRKRERSESRKKRSNDEI